MDVRMRWIWLLIKIQSNLILMCRQTINIIIRMKQHTEILLQTSRSNPSELRAQLKQNDHTISQINASIRRKRSQMKQFSESMTKALQKKLIPKKQSSYAHPNFNPQFQSEHLKGLYSQKESIYAQIAKLKSQIQAIVAEEEPQVKNQYKRKQSVILSLQKQLASYAKQKQLVQQQLNSNRQKLDQFKASTCLKQIQQNQIELTEIKGETRVLEKEMSAWMDEEIGIGMYQRKVDEHVKEMEARRRDEQNNDDFDYQKEIQELCEEIRKIMEDKKLAERQHALEKQQLIKKIKQITMQNDNLQSQIRKIDAQVLQQKLQKKRRQSLVKSSSMPQITKKQPLSLPIPPKPQPQLHHFPSLLLTQPKIYIKQSQPTSPQQSPQSIIIGQWNDQNLIKDDLIENKNNNISRAINIKIKTKHKKIVGMAVVYINRIGVEMLGRSNIWGNANQQLGEGQEQYSIDLDDISAIYYTNNNNKSIGLKFIPKSTTILKPNSGSINSIKLGEFLNQQQQQHELQQINLEHKIIKYIQFTLDNTYTTISGVRLTLVKGEIDNGGGNNGIGQSSIRKHVKRLSNQEGKWGNLSQTGGLTNNNNKKVFLKSNKKLDQIQQKIDHRLMLNRKRKIV